MKTKTPNMLSDAANWISLSPVLLFLLAMGYIHISYTLRDIYLPRPHRFGFLLILGSCTVLTMASIGLSIISFCRQPSARRIVLPFCLSTLILFGIFGYMRPLVNLAFPPSMPIGSWNDPVADFERAVRLKDYRFVIISVESGTTTPGVSFEDYSPFYQEYGGKVIADENWNYPESMDMSNFIQRVKAYSTAYNLLLLAELKRKQDNKQADGQDAGVGPKNSK